MNYRKVADSLKNFMSKQASDGKKEETVKTAGDNLIKTAEDRELYEKGYIFGAGMAEGFFKKLAEEIEESMGAVEPTQPEQSEVAPQQVPAEPVPAELEEIKKIMSKMTPSELAQWLLEQPAEVLKLIADDPDLSAMADEALKAIEDEQEVAEYRELQQEEEEE